MSKCIMAWQGGINFLVQYAARDDGLLFERFQGKTSYGYQWGRWKQSKKQIDINNLPVSIPAGFGEAFRFNLYNGGDYSKLRLP